MGIALQDTVKEISESPKVASRYGWALLTWDHRFRS